MTTALVIDDNKVRKPVTVTMTDADKTYRIDVPYNARSVRVQFLSGTGYIVYSGVTDEEDISGGGGFAAKTDKESYSSGVGTSFILPVPGTRGGPSRAESAVSFFVGTDTAGAKVEITAMLEY